MIDCSPSVTTKPVTEGAFHPFSMCAHDQGELEASEGSSPSPLGQKNAHAHTTHANEKKGIHHPPSYGPL